MAREPKIVVAGHVTVKPEHRDEAVQRAIAIARDSESEDGCISYRFFCDLEDANVFHIFEEWESQEALDAHFQTEHLKEFQQHVAKLVAGPMSIKQYEIASVGKP